MATEIKHKPARRIFDQDPRSWQELQNYVAQVFKEIGCNVETDAEVKLARDVVNLDVFVRDVTTVPHANYVCECKHWSRRIPKSTVHSFRTVMQDLGANHGFIISRNGFQAGAREVARFTNVDLLSWHEFEEMMFDRWLARVTERLDPLFLTAFELMDDEQVEELWKVKECTEESYNEWSGICQRHQLVTAWALLQWHYPRGIGSIASIGFSDDGILEHKDGPIVLNTYRKVVDAAPFICNHARRVLEQFWGLNKSTSS